MLDHSIYRRSIGIYTFETAYFIKRRSVNLNKEKKST